MTVLVVETCGPMTSLQDAGRVGALRQGVSRSGAMDLLALAEANALVGNPPDTAAIELMLAGAVVRVGEGGARIGVSGARMACAIDGLALPLATSADLPEGARLVIGPAAAGTFGYLAVGGGFAVPPVLGSRSLQPRAGIGGLDGRPLRPGDRIPLAGGVPVGGPSTLDAAPLDPDAPLRVVLGPQDDHFSPEVIAAFLATTYTVAAEADRMGYRLDGPSIAHRSGFNIVSDGLLAGSVQVPGSGVPIVMMADHQTTGGYPKIATVISADLRLLAQRRTGDRVRFEAIGWTEAVAAARQRAALIADLPRRLRPVRGGLPDTETLLALNLAGAATNALASEG